MKAEPEIYNISLKVLLKNDKNKILILKAHHNGAMTGFYDLPGGRIGKGEFNTNYEQILARELKSEIGSSVEYALSLKPVSFGRHSYYSKSRNIEVFTLWLCFEANYRGGNIKVSDEHEGYKWINLEEVKTKEYFTKGALEVIERYLKYKN